MLQVAVRWQLKTFDGNIACHAGTTIGLVGSDVYTIPIPSNFGIRRDGHQFCEQTQFL